MMLVLLRGLAAVAGVLSCCSSLVRGDQEARSVPGNVTSVRVSGPFEVYVSQGDNPTLTVSADADMLPHIVTTTRDHQLTIEFDKGPHSTTGSIIVNATIAALSELMVGGTGQVHASGFKTSTLQLWAGGSSQLVFEGRCSKRLRVDVSGSSKVSLIGEGGKHAVELLTAEVSGASKLDVAEGFEADNVEVDVNGASQAEVAARSSVKGTVTGASSIMVRGSPKTRDIDTDFTSRVRYPSRRIK